jgi:hypothetical protein
VDAEKLERLNAAGIQVIPAEQMSKHMLFERDGFVALVERRGEDFGNIGSAGLLTEHGLAFAIYRGPQAFFVCKGFDQPAEQAQIEGLRKFQSDLETALRQPAI